MGINKFADLTFLEYSHLYKANETVKQTSREFLETHDIQPVFELIFYGSTNKLNSTSDDLLDFVLPASFDWRVKGAITAVKDQEYCGSCYAMSTIASIESQLFIKTGKLVQLSEQEIVDCAGEFGTFHCEGGIGFRVYDFIKENGGISDTLDYPYEAKRGKCRRNEKSKIEINIKGYGFVTSEEDDVLMEAIIKFGPIMISIDTDHESFMLYSSGIYFEEKCTTEINHGALLIGFGSEDGNDFWIVKNSFGVQWGELGYIRIARGKGNDCSVNYVPLFPVLDDDN